MNQPKNRGREENYMRIESCRYNSVVVVIDTFLIVFILLFGAASLYGQEVPALQQKGFTTYEEFRASDSNQGQFLIFDTNIGYDFNKHIGTDIGVPVYVLRPTLP